MSALSRACWLRTVSRVTAARLILHEGIITCILSVMPSKLEAVADPVRLQIVRHLEAHGPAQLADLAAGAGVHLNTARTHAAALEADGVIVREPSEPSGRGRPPLSYRLSDDWALPTSDLHGLAELLATVLVRAGADTDELRAVGLEWGRFLLGRPGKHSVEPELPLAL